MGKYYVLYNYLILYGPILRDEAVGIANEIQVSAIRKCMQKRGIDPEKYSNKQRMAVAESLGICNNAFKIMSEDEVFEAFPDSFEYFITSKVMQ